MSINYLFYLKYFFISIYLIIFTLFYHSSYLPRDKKEPSLEVLNKRAFLYTLKNYELILKDFITECENGINNTIRVEIMDKEIAELNKTIQAKNKTFDYSRPYEEYEQFLEPEESKLSELSREKRLLIEPEFEDLPNYGDVMPLKQFVEYCNSGCFIDYDGYGYYVQNNQMSDICILPSDVQHNKIRDDFDKIIWFNK